MGFAGPRLEQDAFVTFDGERLPMTVWPAVDETGRPVEPHAVVAALHGFDDYAQAFAVAGPYWARRGVSTYAFDQRGFGRAPGRGLWAGESAMTKDLRVFCSLLRARHAKAVLAVAGESMGGAVAICAFASSTPPDADRLVLLSPAVWGWTEQPLPNAVGLWLLAHLGPGLPLEPPSFIAAEYRCSDNRAILKAMDHDPNVINATRADATYGLMNLMQRASRRLGAVRVPTLYLYGAHDRMIPKPAAAAAAAELGPLGRSAYYRQGWHLLDRDLHADVVLADVSSFIDHPTAPLPSGAPPIPRPGGWRLEAQAAGGRRAPEG
jgi:alpha-beta hydrolase superfamily lysophospholipase